jgi:hypothetical protein
MDLQSQIAVIVRTAEGDAKLKTVPAEQTKVYTDAATKILGLLSAEQKATLRQLVASENRPNAAARLFASLGLSPEQQAKVDEIMAAAQKDAAATTDRTARQEILTKANQKIRDEVLTPDQKAKLAQQRQGRNGAASRPNRGANAPAQPGSTI